MSTTKVICTECDWHGQLDAIDMIKDPKSDRVWSVCPECRVPENLLGACEHDGCWLTVQAGMPQPDGSYSQTCSKHVPGRNP